MLTTDNRDEDDSLYDHQIITTKKLANFLTDKTIETANQIQYSFGRFNLKQDGQTNWMYQPDNTETLQDLQNINESS